MSSAQQAWIIALSRWKAVQSAKGAVRFSTETLSEEKGNYRVYAYKANGELLNSLEIKGFSLIEGD